MAIIKNILTVIGMTFTTLAIINKPSSIYKNETSQCNPMEGKRVRFVRNENEGVNADGERGYLEVVGEVDKCTSGYDKVVKRVIDLILSFGGLVVLSPILFVLSIAILIDDPGPVIFVQKRIGRNKQYFKLHKFRSMKMSTPHDVPTHMLEDPEQYITKVGKFLRIHSLDELPQIWDIFIGNMSIIGPRPALWNQDVLTSEREQYRANDIKPGLTGWAQINGRDTLEISVKAKMDGEYTSVIIKGGWKALMMDIRCFIGTFFSVMHGEGIVEGGTGEIGKKD